MSKTIVICAHNQNHHSFYEVLINFLCEANFTTTLISYQNIVKHISNTSQPNLHIVYLDETASLSSAYQMHLEHINRHDILIFDEYYENLYQKWLLKMHCDKNIYVIHNVNKWFKCVPSINIKIYLKRLFKQFLISRFDALMVVNPVLKNTIFDDFKWKKEVFLVPFSTLTDVEPSNQIAKSKNIVIPGSVDENRRNYAAILNVFESFFATYPHAEIKLVLLGSANNNSGKIIIDRCREINLKHPGKVIYYESYVSTDEFNLQLLQANYILSNLVTKIKLDDVFETYGVTKETGINYLILANEKIAILPEFFADKVNYRSQAVFYGSDNSLMDILINVENDSIDVSLLKNYARANKIAFKKVIQQERSFLEKWLND